VICAGAKWRVGRAMLEGWTKQMSRRIISLTEAFFENERNQRGFQQWLASKRAKEQATEAAQEKKGEEA